ncbi:MAG: FliH/SctL family protein [Caldilineaceae bacterium]
MAQLIRKYNAGDRIVVSDWLRAHGTGDLEESPEEVARRAAEQALREAEALRNQMETQLAEAQRQIEALIAEAENTAQTLQAEAQAQGYEDGYKQGLVDGQTTFDGQVADIVTQLQAIVAELGLQRQVALSGIEVEAATLSLAVAEKVVGHVAQTHKPLIDHTVHRALSEISVEGPFVVKAHPDDCAFLTKFWQTGSPRRPDAPDGWRLVADESVPPGGCILVCGPTTVDARLKTQLGNIGVGLQLALPAPDSEDIETDAMGEPPAADDIDL